MLWKKIEEIQRKIDDNLFNERNLLNRALVLLSLESRYKNQINYAGILTKDISRIDLKPGELSEVWEGEFEWDGNKNFHILRFQGGEGAWQFSKKQQKISASLFIRLIFDERRRGIRVLPEVCGDAAYNSTELASWRFFKAVANSRLRNLHKLIYQIAESNRGFLMIFWEEMHLSGLRSLASLFSEFNRLEKNEIDSLAQTHTSPFRPNPYDLRPGKNEKLYLSEQLHGYLFDLWEEQLENFKSNLQI